MKYLLSFLQLLFVMVVLLAVVATIGYVNVFVVTPWLHGIGPDVDYASKISGAVAFVTPVLTVISILVIVANFISQDKARVEDSRERHFFQIANLIIDLVSDDYLSRAKEHIQQGLSAAECGALLAKTTKVSSVTDIADCIAKQMTEKLTLALPPRVKSTFLALSKLKEQASDRQSVLFVNSVRAFAPPILASWIIADALKNKDLDLFRAAHLLGLTEPVFKTSEHLASITPRLVRAKSLRA